MASSLRSRNMMVAVGLVAFVGSMASFPFVYKRYYLGGRNLSTSREALPGQAIVRGAYVNTGSRDIGPDPDYDPSTGTWRGRTSVRQRAAEMRASAAAPSTSEVAPAATRGEG